MKFNIGCGKDIKEGYVNVDKMPLPGVDLVLDLENDKWPVEFHNKAEEIYMSHVIEHLKNPLFVMEELWHVASSECKLIIRVPYGSSDNAWEDPTHVRPYFPGSWAYFSQIYYVGADYGYRADWDIDRIILDVFADRCDSNDPAQILEREIKLKRNMVNEMVVVLIPIKPIRDPDRDLFNAVYPVTLNFI